MLSPSHIKQIRSRFPVFRNKVYLNSCSQGALSDAVRQSFNGYLDTWDEHGSPWDLWMKEYEGARATFADFIGALADEVAIVPSASAGINSIASALSFRARNKVALGAFDFPTMGHIWLAQRPRGAEVVFVEPIDNRLPAEQYAKCIDSRTAIVPVAGLCFSNGWRAEIKDIVAHAHAHGALVLLDDYQDCGTRPIDVNALDVDIYVTGTLKYLLGPSGVAMMYVRSELAKSLLPTISGWFAQTNPFAFDVRSFDPSPTARRFEAGTPPIPSLYGAQAGVRLLGSIGMGNVAAHIAELAATLICGAQDLGIELKTSDDSVGPLVVLKCRDAELLVNKLADQQVVASSRHDGVRFGLHVYNTAEDISYVLEMLERNLDLLALSKTAAAHT